MDYDKVNDCARALMGAVKRWHRRANFEYTSGGTADVQTLTLSVAPSAYTDTMVFGFIAGAGLTNTGAATMNVSALGAKTIKRPDGSTDLSAGDITAGKPHVIWYDGTNFRLIMPWLPTIIDDNAVTLADMEHGTQGDILYYGASGAPTRLSAGTSGQFLKTQGAGANPTWADASTTIPAGTIIARSHASTASLVTINAAIALDDSIPQNTEGVEVLTVNHTPAASGNKLLIRAVCPFGVTNDTTVVGALFIGSTANALASVVTGTNHNQGIIVVTHEYTATGTSQVTFKLRMGRTTGTGYANGDSGGSRLFGGVSSCTLSVEEKKA